jgi:hypothetical protein
MRALYDPLVSLADSKKNCLYRPSDSKTGKKIGCMCNPDVSARRVVVFLDIGWIASCWVPRVSPLPETKQSIHRERGFAREPKVQLSATTLFAESTRSRSRCRAPSSRAFWLPLSAKGSADGTTSVAETAVSVRQIRREAGIHGSRRINTHGGRNTFAESKPSSVSALALLTVKFSKKLHIFNPKLFPSSTYTHTMFMLKIGAVLSLFAIFNNFTSLYVFFLIRPI